MSIESVLNVTCSKAASKEHKPVDCNLLEELQNTAYIAQQAEIRNEPNTDIQDELKSRMPVLLPSCTCKGTKGKNSITSHTRLMGIDIDKQDNLHVPNFHELKAEFTKIPNVAYCGLSVRGQGYILIIPIAHPVKHSQHFAWMEKWFLNKGLNVDPSGVNINRLRYYSYDSKAYFNHTAKPLQAYYVPPVLKPKNVQQKIFKGQSVPVWTQYNEGLFFIEVLEKYGWQIESKTGQKTYFTRPGKTSGVSAEFDEGKNVFYVFTSSTEFESNKGYNPFQVFTILEHGGDFSKAAKSLTASKDIKVKHDLSSILKNIAPSKHLAPAVAPPAIIKKATPPGTNPEPPATDMEAYFLGLTKRHFLKHGRKITKEKYYAAWAQSMTATFNSYNINQQSFLNQLL